MLTRSFIVFPRIGLPEEKKLWDAGILSWNDFLNTGESRLRQILGFVPRKALRCVAPWQDALDRKDASFFQSKLPPGERFRAFPHWTDSICFLDIETTGSQRKPERITVIGCFDGHSPKIFQRHANLNDCIDYLEQFSVLVTYNGSQFDLPMIESSFDKKMHPHLHIDLRPVFQKIQINWGLKRLEKEFGLPRNPSIEDADGYRAIQLWRKYRKNGDSRNLQELVRYNLADAVHLDPLLHIAYNRHIEIRHLPFPKTALPRTDSQALIEKAMKEYFEDYEIPAPSDPK